MEVPGAGEQEPGAAAAAPGQEIDLSLDDIIQRNQRAQPNWKPWQQRQLKTRNGASGNGRPRFQSWGPPTLPGFPKGFRKPPWTKKPFWGRMSTPGPRAAGQMQGRSPLNRPAFAQQDKSGKAPPGRNGDGPPSGLSASSTRKSRSLQSSRDVSAISETLPIKPRTSFPPEPHQIELQQTAANQVQNGAETFKGEKVENAAQFWSSPDRLGVQPAGRHPQGYVSSLDTWILGPQDCESWTSSSIKPALPLRSAGGCLWRFSIIQEASAVLTEQWRMEYKSFLSPPFSQNCRSFPDEKRNVLSRPGAKRPFLRRWNSRAPQLRRQPRGVTLRFNFRAMANQTSVTLNERFSGLRHKRHFVAERNVSRTVTLP